jgi:hypothetical protein
VSGPAPDMASYKDAVEAALKLAAEWDETADAADAAAARAAERGAAPFRTDMMAAGARARRDCADGLRAVINKEFIVDAEPGDNAN